MTAFPRRRVSLSSPLPCLASKWVWTILFLQLMIVTNAADGPPTRHYQFFCDVTENPIVTLEWDATMGRYVLQRQEAQQSSSSPSAIDDDDDQNTDLDGSLKPTSGWGRRLWESLFFVDDDDEYDEYEASYLRSSSAADKTDAMSYSTIWNDQPALLVDTIATTNNSSAHRNLQSISSQQQQEPEPPVPVTVLDNDINEPLLPIPQTIQARACACGNTLMVWGGDYYCTTPRTHCAIPSSPIARPGCVDVQKQRRIVRNIWPVLVVWYASVLFCLSFTITGRHAMGCCLATIYPAWNQQTADRLLREDPNQANQMLLRHYRVMRARYERRFLRRLRRRARRERQQQNGNNTGGDANNNNNNNNPTERQDEDEPFPSLWDLAIFPRQTAHVSSEPIPVTLTLKTRIYKRKDEDNKEIEKGADLTKTDAPIDRDNNMHDTNDVHSNTNESGLFRDQDPQSPEDPLAPAIKSSEANEILPFDDSELHDKDDDEDDAETKTACLDQKAEKEEQQPQESIPPIVVPEDLKDDKSVDSFDDDENTCTICYVPLEDGDRVGALPCGHVFHVDPCLKHWLTRRNVCPLCLTENIATPQFGEDAEAAAAARSTPATATVADEEDDSSSDVDLSSSRNEQDDDNSSGILDQGPIPAFAGFRRRRPNATAMVITDRRGPPMIELTPSSWFRRPRLPRPNLASEVAPPATTTTETTTTTTTAVERNEGSVL